MHPQHIRRTLRILGAVVGLAAVGFVVLAWYPALTPIDPPLPTQFTAGEIRHGAELAAIGGCATCHTADGGTAFAGGRAIPTPFGAVYSTNISPDTSTGIGRWSLEAFGRAMRKGVDREGEQLYPAFPYDHFTLVTDADNESLYAYLMTRDAVQAPAPVNKLPFPLSVRPLIAAWKLLFLRVGPYRNDVEHDVQWNRGAYLTNGLGHCGSCHSARNSLGAETDTFAGAEQDGWRAYALGPHSAARQPWDPGSLYTFLRSGWHGLHGIAYGPMAAVSENLAAVPEGDVRAIASYVGAQSTTRRLTVSQPDPLTRTPAAETETGGAAIYAAACAACHDGSGQLPLQGIHLTLSTAVTDSSASNLLNVVLDGLKPPPGTAGAIMPGFAGVLTDGQLVALAAFVRANFGHQPPWNGVEATLRSAREDRGHD